MKKIIIVALVAASVVGSICAVTSQDVSKYIDLHKKYKSKWFEYKKGLDVAALDLMKKQHEQTADLTKSRLASLAKDKDVDAHFTAMLKDKIDLDQKHLEESHALYSAWHNKAYEQYQAEKAELAKFKDTVFPSAQAEIEVEEE